MLREVLQAVEAAEGSITLNELSHRLNIDPGVLVAMLEHWSRKGKLVISQDSTMPCATPDKPATCSCGTGASGAGCPFLARLPRSYTIGQPADGDNLANL